jgi:hypothetical protein
MAAACMGVPKIQDLATNLSLCDDRFFHSSIATALWQHTAAKADVNSAQPTFMAHRPADGEGR